MSTKQKALVVDDTAFHSNFLKMFLGMKHYDVTVATDGVEDPWYPFTRHAGPLYTQLLHGVGDTVSAGGVTSSHRAPVLTAPDPVHALIEWLAFEKRGENDDRTLCVIRQDGVAWAP